MLPQSNLNQNKLSQRNLWCLWTDRRRCSQQCVFSLLSFIPLLHSCLAANSCFSRIDHLMIHWSKTPVILVNNQSEHFNNELVELWWTLLLFFCTLTLNVMESYIRNRFFILTHGIWWNAQSHLNKIFILQKRALRLMHFTNNKAHAIPL